MCVDMMDLKKAETRIIELEEELKFTRNGYEEEIKTLLEKNDDLVEKIGIFMGGPVPREDDGDPISRTTTSSSTTPIQIQVMMTTKMKLEQTSWSLPPIKISR